jgi:transposase
MLIEEADAGIKQVAQENDGCRRLVTIPGVGTVTATALIAAIGNGAAFRKGREFAAGSGLFLANTPHVTFRIIWALAHIW